ncbi:ABC transporter related (fragment) [Bradyrhizobium sp. STM 3809]
MPGLDPGIHPLSKSEPCEEMDGRVKPGHDDWVGSCMSHDNP